MTEVIEPPLIPNPEALVELAVERMQAQYPNFNPNPASPEYRMFLAFAAIAAETIILAFDVPEAIIRFVGAVVYQEPITPAAAATCESTWHAIDSLGHVIPEGQVVIITPEGGSPIGFEVTEEVTITAGKTEATKVKLQAVESGTEGNITVASEVTMQEPLNWVSSIVLAANPTGGAEEESIEEYTKRIVELARLVAPRPIVPEDFANFVRLLTTKEKVLRAVALNGVELEVEGEHTKVNGSGEGTVKAENQERCVTVIAMNGEGKHLSTAAREEAEEKLKKAREVNFKSFVAGPTVHAINVEVVGKFFKGYTEASVKAAVEEALKTLLSPVTWGTPSGSNTIGWTNRTTLRYQDVVTAVNNVPGFNYYTTLKLNGETVDIPLTGIAPVTEIGTLTITLTEGTE